MRRKSRCTGFCSPDFTVKEDGKVQAIRNFEEYDATAEQAPPQLPPGTYSNRGAAAPRAVNILLFDDVIVPAEKVAFERLQALKYLTTIPPGSQVAVIEQADHLRIIHGFTSDQSVLRAAVDAVRPDNVAGIYFPQSLPPMMPGGVAGADQSPLPSALLPSQPERCAVMNRKSALTTAALAGIANFLSGIKGRKNLIWFTPGIYWVTHYATLPQSPIRSCLLDFSDQLHNDYNLLNAAQVAVYPVLLELGPPNPSMWDIADATGGVAYSGRNWLDVALKEAITNGTNYYMLSYVPPLSNYDGKYHTIDVKVDRPGLQLNYRKGYTALDPVQARADKKHPNDAAAQPAGAVEQSVSQFHDAMEYGPGGNDLKFDLHIQPSAAGSGSPETLTESLNPKVKGQPLTRYDIQYTIPAGEITLPGDNSTDPSGTEVASAQLAVAVFSADGVLLNAAGRTVSFPIRQDQAAQFLRNASRVTVQVDLPPGKVFVRAGILDVASQKWGTLEIPDAASVK